MDPTANSREPSPPSAEVTTAPGPTTDRAAEGPPTLDALRGRVQEVYRGLDATIQALAPRCELSGRCCRFQEYDHTLFLSEVEARILLADAPAPSRPLDDGETCPWQDTRGRCTARDARPLGCRVYFCDPEYEGHAPSISEQYLAQLRQLTEDLGLPWNYAPLHGHLRRATLDGRLKGVQDTGRGALSGAEVSQTT